MRDLEERLPLESLDPASKDPGFWLRFHGRVMGDAESELARRRMMGEISVADVVFAWRRALVPMVLLAAAMAGILILGHEPPQEVQVVALEEVFSQDFEVRPMTAALSGEGGVQSGLFAGAEEGF
jgi:anti-sigma factor RsiW